MNISNSIDRKKNIYNTKTKATTNFIKSERNKLKTLYFAFLEQC